MHITSASNKNFSTLNNNNNNNNNNIIIIIICAYFQVSCNFI